SFASSVCTVTRSWETRRSLSAGTCSSPRTTLLARASAMEELNTGNASTRVTPTVRFGVNLMPRTWVGRPPLVGAALKAYRARLLDRMHQAGMDHVMVGDHVMFQDGVGNDGLTDAASVATTTDELGVYLAVYLMVLRHPVLVVRQILTVAQFAPGRLSLGLGI